MSSPPTTEKPEHPFDKVFLVAQIAGHEMHVASLKEDVRRRDEANGELTSRLRDQSLVYRRAAALSEARVLEQFTRLSAWFSGDDAAKWRDLLQKENVTHGLCALTKALIVEVLNDGPGGDKAAAGDSAAGEDAGTSTP